MKTSKSLLLSALFGVFYVQTFAAVPPPPPIMAFQAAAMAQQAAALAQQAILSSQEQSSVQSTAPQVAGPPGAVAPQLNTIPQTSSVPQVAVAPQINETAAPAGTVAPATSPAPAQVLKCECPAGKNPVMFAGICVCGECLNVSSGIKKYNKACPDHKFAEFIVAIDNFCKEIENTEDCEYFKKSPGSLTDDFKRCRDDLDSIMDDCEDQAECCSTMKLPEVPGAPKEEADD